MRPTHRQLELVAIISIAVLTTYLRFVNLATNPGWFSDEGTHLDIARNLIAGRVQYLALDQSLLLVSRLPLFENVLALWARVFGVNMLALRSLTATLGTLTVVTMWTMVRRVSNQRGLALLAAFLLAIYPPAVLYCRFGFSYNLIAPLLLMTTGSLITYARDRQRRWLVLAACSIGLSCLSDLWAFTLLLPFAIVVLMVRWRDLVWSLPLAVLPFGLYALTMSTTLVFDLRFVLARTNQLTLSQQAATLLQNVTTLSAQDGWFVLGLLGLLLLRSARLRWVMAAFAIVPLVMLGRTTALFSLSAYYLIPLWPLIALGVASLIVRGGELLPATASRAWRAFRRTSAYADEARPTITSASTQVDAQPNGSRGANTCTSTHALPAALRRRRARRARCSFAVRRWRTVLAIGLGGTIGLLTGPPLWLQTTTHFRTDIDSFLIDPVMAQSAIEFVNGRVRADEVVIASPTLAWQIQSNVADFQMPLAYHGQATPHLPADVPRDRWAFDPSWERARFIIVDNLWRNWAVPDVSGVREMLSEVEKWPRVFQAGEVSVYQNPR